MSKKSRYAGSTRSLTDKRISNRIEGKSKRMSVGNKSQLRDNAERNIRLIVALSNVENCPQVLVKSSWGMVAVDIRSNDIKGYQVAV